MTIPRNPELWQKLRGDKRSAVAVILTITAGIAAILAAIALLLPPTHSTDRTNPLYWALLLPFAWWATALANYTPWATRNLRPAAAAAALTTLAALADATATQSNQTPWLIAAAIALPCAAISAILYPKSLLAAQQNPTQALTCPPRINAQQKRRQKYSRWHQRNPIFQPTTPPKQT